MSPAGARPRINERSDPLFARHPLVGTHVTSHGVTVPTPYHCYDGDALLLLGRADLAVVDGICAGTGRLATRTSDGKAVVGLWLMEYHDTSVGPYRELVVTMMAGTARRRLDYRGPFSLLGVMSQTSAAGVITDLVLDQQVPIDYGREDLGLDKRMGKVEFGRVDGRRTFVVDDELGERVISGAVTVGRGWRALAGTAVAVVRAVGLRTAVRAAFGPQRLMAVSHDVLNPGSVVETETWMRGTGTAHAIDAGDRIEVGGGSRIGRALRAMAWAPALAWAEPHVKTVFTDPRRR